MPSSASPTKVGLWLLGGATLVAAGALAGVAYVSLATPAALGQADDVTSFPVGTATFDDARPVLLAADRGAGSVLTSPASGRVTDDSCRAGDVIDSGTSPLSIDDSPVVALATALPLWRDLSVGVSGNDVTALQKELARLGHPVEPTGRFDWQTIEAVNDLREGIGDTTWVNALPLDQVLWIPARATPVESCTAAVGAEVTAGAEIATTPGALTRVTITDDLPSDLVAGQRAVVVDGLRVDVDPGDPITDRAPLGELDTLSTVRKATPDEPVAARLVLTEPVQVSVVPPSAVLAPSQDTTCVVADGSPVPVDVVGSELGRTFVLFAGEAPVAIDPSPERDTTCT